MKKALLYVCTFIIALYFVTIEPLAYYGCDHNSVSFSGYDYVDENYHKVRLRCNDCEEIIESSNPELVKHNWSSWDVDKAATPYKEGYYSRQCYDCYKIQYRPIAKKKLTTNQRKAEKVVKTYLKAAKSYNIKKLNKCFKKDSKKYGYPTKKIKWVFKKYNKKISWELLDVTGNGKSVKVKVRINRPDLYSQAYDAVCDALIYGIDHNKSSDYIANSMFKRFSSKVKKGKITNSSKTVTFTVVKTKKGWKLKSKSRTIVDIATLFFWEGMDDAGDEIIRIYS